MIKNIFTVFTLLFCGMLHAAEFYVDGNSSAENATGAMDAPFKTIRAAVDAANNQYNVDALPGIINIKGGEYTIATADDLISVTASNLTIQAWVGTGTPRINLDSELSASINNSSPSIITVESSALECFIKGLEFYYSIDNTKNLSGNSLGEKGKIIDIYAGFCTVDGCKFFQNEKSTATFGLSSDGVIYSQAQENVQTLGYNLTVKNCFFSKVGRSGGRVIRGGSYVKMIDNIFDDCAGYFFPVKKSIGGHFISNRVVNARASIFSNGQNYSEYNNMEIAYNIFVNATSEPFFQKSSAGMSSVKIHHNTIVGGRAFVATYNANKFQWTPSFYNNLIILTDVNTAVITEEEVNVGDVNPTTFKKGSLFRDNVWLAENFNGGSAPLKLEQYKLVAASIDETGLYVDNNSQLSIAPEFLETEDVFSDDFYRLNSVRYPWAEGLNSSSGTTPAYIGAVEPVASEGEPGEFFSIDSFSVSGEGNGPLSVLTFSVSYLHNAGEVTVWFDFNGDGKYDQEGTERSVTHVYQVAGDYYPSVKIKDNKTGKELTAGLTVPLLKIRRLVSYVDCLAAKGGDGTEAKPYRTIKEAIATADNTASIYVRGGEGRVYTIASKEDLLSIPQYRLTITSQEGFENARIVVSHELPANTNTTKPYAITIERDAFEVVLSNLDFVWYGQTNSEHPANSLGDEGRLINISGDYATVKNCRFRLEGAYGKSQKSFAIRADATQGGTQPGANMRIEGCLFEGVTGNDKHLNAVFAGNNPVIVQNVFTNCNYSFTPLKEGCDFVTFSSNSLYECNSIYTANMVFGGSAELPNGEISYNKFITGTATPFIVLGSHGLHESNSRVHHNTVIGASSFMRVEISKPDRKVKPKIYDNLILLAPGGIVIEDVTTLFSGGTSYFDSETTFNNNVYLASAYFGKALSGSEGYEMTVAPVDCRTLTEMPRFLSTVAGDADEYRLRSKKDGWAYATSVGGYPNHVGAVDPLFAPFGLFIVIK